MKLNKIIAVAIVLTTALGPVASTFSASPLFTTEAYAVSSEKLSHPDPADDWAQEAIHMLRQLGIMQGDPDGHFRAYDQLTREEFATLLVKLLKLDLEASTTSTFRDVEANRWSLKYIEALSQTGLMVGDGDGTFRPAAPISREEVAAVIVRALGVDVSGLGAKLSFADKDSISTWAKDAVQYLYEMNVVKGDGVNFAPKRSAQRQEIAVIIHKSLPLFEMAEIKTVEKVEGTEVVFSGKTYTVAESLQGLFAAVNQDALKGAKIKFERDGNQVTKVTYLEITSSGEPAEAGQPEFSGNVVLGGGNAALNGNLKISGNYISVKDLTVTGDLEIGTELQNDFYANNLKVLGKTTVNGGDTNTVVYENSTLGPVEINKPDVRIEGKGTTTVGTMTVNTNATISADHSVVIPKVTLGNGAHQVSLAGTITTMDKVGESDTKITGSVQFTTVKVSGAGNVEFDTTGQIDKLEVANPEATITLQTGVKIKDLVIPSGMEAKDIVTDYEQVKGQIGYVNGTPTTPPGPPDPPPGDGNHQPEAKPMQERKVKTTETATFSPSDVATDVDGDTLHFVAGSASSSANDVVTATLVGDILTITPVHIGHGVVHVRVTDGRLETPINIPAHIVVSEQMQANVECGDTFTEHDAGQEALIHLTKTDEDNQQVADMDLSALVVKHGDTTLLAGTDYTVDEETDLITVGESYLNTMSAGTQVLTFSADGVTDQANLTVLEVDPYILAAIHAVNTATDRADTRSAIESYDLKLQLVPYSYLTEGQKDKVAEAVLTAKGTGYISRSAIQDIVDIKVDQIQNEGGLEAAMAEVNAATTVEEMLDALSSPQLALDHEGYMYLEGYEREIVAQYILDNRGAGYTTREEIQAAFTNIVDMIFEDWNEMIEDLEALEIGFAEGDHWYSVTKDITLPTEGPLHGTTFEWTSQNPAVISDTGVVTRPTDEDVEVTFDGLLTQGYEHLNIQIGFLVKAIRNGLVATAVNGEVFIEKSAGTDAVFHVEQFLNDEPVATDLSNLIVKNGNVTLIKGTDYTVDDVADEVAISESYLNQLAQDFHTLTFDNGSKLGKAELFAYPMTPELVAAIDAVNGATDAQSTRTALEEEELGLALTPYRYLTNQQRNDVAQIVLDGKGDGFVSRGQIQDAFDLAVTEVQMSGDEASAVQVVNDATTIEEMLGALMSPHLRLDNEFYSYLEGYEREIVAQYLLDHRGYGYLNRDQIQTTLDEIIAMVIEDWYKIIDDLYALEVGYAPGDSAGSVTQNLTLPTVGAVHGANIAWTSSKPAVITNDGQVTRQAADTTVTLTALLTNRYEHYETSVTVTVKGTNSIDSTEPGDTIDDPAVNPEWEQAKLRFTKKSE